MKIARKVECFLGAVYPKYRRILKGGCPSVNGFKGGAAQSLPTQCWDSVIHLPLNISPVTYICVF